MEVYALIGETGTGKSHNALTVANKYNIDAIIDDGLLIRDSLILAGYSAKRESNKIQAIKRALFLERSHCEEVKNAIKEFNLSKILILGTSRKMIDKIVDVLELPVPSTFIDIEDVSSKGQIEEARRVRLSDGIHAVPVPRIQVKKKIPFFLLDSLYSFYRKNPTSKRRTRSEKSIVRPPFSYLGKLVISDDAVITIVKKCLESHPNLANLEQAKVELKNDGLVINLSIIVDYGINATRVAQRIQYKVIDEVEHLTGLNVIRVNVTVRGFGSPNS